MPKQRPKTVPVRKIVSDPWTEVSNFRAPVLLSPSSQLVHDIVHSFEGRVFLWRFHACGRQHYLAGGSISVLDAYQFDLTPWGAIALQAWRAGFAGTPFQVFFKGIMLPPQPGSPDARPVKKTRPARS